MPGLPQHPATQMHTLTHTVEGRRRCAFPPQTTLHDCPQTVQTHTHTTHTHTHTHARTPLPCSPPLFRCLHPDVLSAQHQRVDLLPPHELARGLDPLLELGSLQPTERLQVGGSVHDKRGRAGSDQVGGSELFGGFPGLLLVSVVLLHLAHDVVLQDAPVKRGGGGRREGLRRGSGWSNAKVSRRSEKARQPSPAQKACVGEGTNHGGMSVGASVEGVEGAGPPAGDYGGSSVCVQQVHAVWC